MIVTFEPDDDLALSKGERRLVLEVAEEAECGSTYGVRQHRIDWQGAGLPVYRRLLSAFVAANETFGERLESIDRVAVATYGEGDGLPWHRDDRDAAGAPSGVVLGLVGILSDDHAGGELEFLLDGRHIAPPQPAGTMFVFPARVAHRVTPVVSGERRSLIAFAYGRP